MTSNSLYQSYGYFFSEGKTNEGSFYLLPNGHNTDDRKKVVVDNKVQFDFCLFLYSEDNKNYKGSFLSDDPELLGTEKDLETSRVFKKSDFSFIK